MDGVIEGRIVHYVLDRGPNAGQHRAAMIVRVWGEFAPPVGTVNLRVFLDGSNDTREPWGNDSPILWVTSVKHDPTGTQERSWHWIERA